MSPHSSTWLGASRLALLVIALFIVGACAHANSAPTSLPQPAAAKPRRDESTLARVDTSHYGHLEVLTQGERRHALVTPVGTWPAPDQEDAMVTLLRRMRTSRAPASSLRVLVIGVGTGQVARDLVHGLGAKVDVIERDAALAKLVHDHLGGTASAHVVIEPQAWEMLATGAGIDGIAGPYDAFLVDEAFATDQGWRQAVLTVHQMGQRKESTLRLEPHAIVLGRLPPLQGFFEEGELEGPFVFATERPGDAPSSRRLFDNIQLLAPRSFDLFGQDVAAWPSMHGIQHEEKQFRATKRARAFGFVGTSRDGSLVLRVPHRGAGEVTITLTGDVAERAFGARARAVDFDQTMLRSDEADASYFTNRPIASLIGPGGPPSPSRPLVVSPLVAAVRGEMKLEGARVDETTGYADTTFRMEVTSIEATIDRASWDPIGQRLNDRIDQAAKAITKRDLGEAADLVHSSVVEIEGLLGEDRERSGLSVVLVTLEADLRRLAATTSHPSEICESLATMHRPGAQSSAIHAWVWPKLRTSIASAGVKLSERALLEMVRNPKLRRVSDNEQDRQQALAQCWFAATWDRFPSPVHAEVHAVFPHLHP